MEIEIRYEKFNNEFEADIELSPGNFKYIASDNVKTLLDNIYEILLNSPEMSDSCRAFLDK